MKADEDEDDDVTIGVGRYPCLPSLVALQQMRNRLHMAHDGKRLMKWSAMATGRELRRIAEDIDGVFNKFYEDVKNCFMLLARCRYYFHNFNRMVLESVAPEACVTVNTSTKGVTGVRIALYEIVESGLDPYPLLGVERGGEAVLEAKRAWLELLKRLIHMLELRASFTMIDTAHNNAQKGPNSDNPTMPYLEHPKDHSLVKLNEKIEEIFEVQRMTEIKVANMTTGSLHVCKNCLAMFESQDEKVRDSLCTDCAEVEALRLNNRSATVNKLKLAKEVINDKKEIKTYSVTNNFTKVRITYSNISIDHCLRKTAGRKDSSVYARVEDCIWPYAKAVICMNVKDKVSSKKKSKSNSKELGTFENKYRQIVKIIRSKNSDGSVSEERKTITIRTEKAKPSCSQATSSNSVKKEKNVTVVKSSKESNSKKSESAQNTSKPHSKARQTKSEKIALSDSMGTPRLKTSLSDDTLQQIASIDSNTAKDSEEIKTYKEKGNVNLTFAEHKDDDESCACNVLNKTSKVRIKEVGSIHAIRPARTLMELTNNEKPEIPQDSDNVSLVSFATSYSLDEESIQMSAHDVLKPDLIDAKIRSKDVSFNNKLEDEDTVCSASFTGHIGLGNENRSKIDSTNACWRDAGSDTSDNKNRQLNIPSYADISSKLYSTNRNVCVDARNVSKTEQRDTAGTNTNISSPTQTLESSFPIACQSTDRYPRLIDEVGLQLPSSKMFTNFSEAMENINVPKKYHIDRPVKSLDYKSNEIKRLEDLYKIKGISESSKPSSASPKIAIKLESDSMSRLTHDIPIRTRMHNESPRVSGEIIYSHLNPKLFRKSNKASEGTKKLKHYKSDAMVETETDDIAKPVTDNRGTSPVGSFPLIPLKIHEIVPKCYSDRPRPTVTRATSPKLSIANLPVISASSQLTLTQNVLNNELPKILSITPTTHRDQTAKQDDIETNSICEIKIVPKNFNYYNTLADEDAGITVERLKELLKNSNLENLEKVIHPTVKELTTVHEGTSFPRPHVVCAATPIISEAEIKASSCNSFASCPNPDCPVKKMCCLPVLESKPETEAPPEKVDVAVSTFERDRPKRKVDFKDSECKSTCSVPVALPKCAKCRATLMRADASTSTKTNARFDVRPLSKLILTRVITETQSDSCLYCGKPCGKPGFRRGGQKNIKSPSPSFQCCVKPIPKAQSLSNCRFAECDC